jgi:hypothetical protein
MIIDAAGERSEQGRLLSNSPGSSNAVLDGTPVWTGDMGNRIV